MSKRPIAPMIILLIIQFLVMVGFGIIIPILPFFVQTLGGNAFSLGIFMSVYSIMQFFFAPIWGRLSDRIGRRPVMLIGLGGYGVTFVLFGMVNNLYLLIGLRALSGMISSATLPTAMAYVADITQGADRSKGMGMIGAAIGLGMVFGPALGGWLGHYAFALPFFTAGGLALLLVPFTWILLPESLGKSASAFKIGHGIQLNLQVMDDPLFILFVFNFVLNFAMAMFETTLALLSAAKVGFGPGEMGALFAILGVTAVIVQGGLIGPLVSRYGDARLVITGALISAAWLVMIILSANVGQVIYLAISTVVFMVGNSITTPTSSSLVTKQSLHGQGASLGFFASFASLGRILGPVSGGALFGLNMGLPYTTGAALLLFIVLMAGRKLDAIKSPQPQE